MHSCFFFTAVTKSSTAWYRSVVQWLRTSVLYDYLILPRMSVSWSLSFMSVLRTCSGNCCATSQSSWHGRRTWNCLLNFSHGMACQTQIHMPQSTYFKLMYLSIHTGQKRMCTTVYYTTMSTTHTTMSSTPCSALLIVMRLKPRCIQHLLTRRYFCFICSVLL